jgi:hypothetical protein
LLHGGEHERVGRVRLLPLAALVAVTAALAAAQPAASAARWEFTITGTSTVIFDYGPDRERVCDPSMDDSIGTAVYKNSITATATVREQRNVNTRSGFHLGKPAPLKGTVRQSATETWDEHFSCQAGGPATERTCSTGERTKRLNRHLHQLQIANNLGKKSYVAIGHRSGREGLVFPALSTHCKGDVFSWLDERTRSNGYASKLVPGRYWARRGGTLALTPPNDFSRQPFTDPSWGTVDFRVTLKWRRRGGRMRDPRRCLLPPNWRPGMPRRCIN